MNCFLNLSIKYKIVKFGIKCSDIKFGTLRFRHINTHIYTLTCLCACVKKCAGCFNCHRGESAIYDLRGGISSAARTGQILALRRLTPEVTTADHLFSGGLTAKTTRDQYFFSCGLSSNGRRVSGWWGGCSVARRRVPGRACGRRVRGSWGHSAASASACDGCGLSPESAPPATAHRRHVTLS